MSRCFSLLVLFVGFMRLSMLAGEVERPPEVNATILGIPFEQIEARWEGGIRDSVLVTKGRLPGSTGIARFERRIFLGDHGWESSMRLDLPLAYIEDVSGIFGNIPGLEGVSGSGAVGIYATVTGAGENKEWKGTLQFEEVDLTEEELDLDIEGLRGEFDWAYADGAFTTAPRQAVSFRSLSWDDFQTGKGELEFEMVSAEEWRLNRALLHWAGGRLAANNFTYNPKFPDVTVTLGAEGIRFGELLRLVPDFDGHGEGILDGILSLRIRREGVGLQPGALALRANSPARLQLPRKAWLTEGMSPEQENYEHLRMVERALEDIELRRFRLDFLSERAPGVPFQLILEGRPLGDDVSAPSVSLRLNIHGPIRELGNWVLKPGLTIGVH